MINFQQAKIIAIIPARFASTRFPGKPLVMIQGKTMINRVFDQVKKSKLVNHVIVATDDARIYEHVLQFGGHAMMTSSDHPSGTDRCAAVANLFPSAEIILNVQGDEPFIQAEQIDLLVNTLKANPGYPIATLAKKITESDTLFNYNVVKVVTTFHGEAIYFSRQPIPFVRGEVPENWISFHDYYKHIGLYAFRRNVLQMITTLNPSPLEQAESLEQLRWIENGLCIAIGYTNLETFGVDVPEDLQRLPTDS